MDDLTADLQALAQSRLSASGIQFAFAGHPIVTSATTTALEQDFVILNLIGAAFAVFVLGLALRSVLLAILTAMVSGTGLLWAIGCLGWIGVEINVISIALPVLVLVLCFSDALHLAIDQRACALDGKSDPVQRTLRRIAPACILTSVTTAIAFIALGLVGLGTDLKPRLGRSASSFDRGRRRAGGSCIGLPDGCSSHRPIGGVQRSGRETVSRPELERVVPDRHPPMRKSVAVLAIATTAIAVGLYASAPPRFNLYENLASDHVVRENFDPARAGSWTGFSAAICSRSNRSARP